MNNLSNLEVSSFGLKKGRRSPDIATSPSTSHLHRDLITFSSLSGDEVGRGRRDEREKRQKDGQWILFWLMWFRIRQPFLFSFCFLQPTCSFSFSFKFTIIFHLKSPRKGRHCFYLIKKGKNTILYALIVISISNFFFF